MNAERASLDRGDTTLFVRQRSITRRADAHLRRENRRATEVDGVRQEVTTTRAVSGTELEVGADEERNCRQALHRVQLRGDLHRPTNRHYEPADVLILHVSQRARPARARGRSEVAEYHRPNELRRLVAKR